MVSVEMKTSYLTFCWHLFGIFTVCGTSLIQHDTWPKIHDNATQEDAMKICLSQNLTLPTDLSRDQHEVLMGMFRNESTPPLWLGIVRENSKNWSWLNGTTYSGRLIRDADHLTCGAMGETLPYASDCFSLIGGYICQYECSACPATPCKRLPDSLVCYVFYLERSNWFTAASRCTGRNGTLLMSTSSHVPVTRDNELWIGLTKGPWYYTKKNKKRFVVEARWRPSVVTEMDKSCSTVQKDGDTTAWTPEDCGVERAFVCLPEEWTSQTSTSVTTYSTGITSNSIERKGGKSVTYEPTSDREHSTATLHKKTEKAITTLAWTVPLAAALGVFLFLTGLALVVFFMKRKYNSRQEGVKEIAEGPGTIQHQYLRTTSAHGSHAEQIPYYASTGDPSGDYYMDMDTIERSSMRERQLPPVPSAASHDDDYLEPI